MDVEATTYLEIQIGLEGTFQPGYPETGPSYASGGEPGQPDSIEDVGVTSLTYQQEQYVPGEGWKKITRFDLLEGVDRKSEAFLKIAANIVKALGAGAEEALLDEVEG